MRPRRAGSLNQSHPALAQDSRRGEPPLPPAPTRRELFDRAEALRPGAKAVLSHKALLLVGGPASMTPQPGHSVAATIFLTNQADALLYYCNGTNAAVKEVPGLVSLPVPDNLEVGPVYGMAVLSDQPAAARLALYILSECGQAMLVEAGLLPVMPAR